MLSHGGETRQGEDTLSVHERQITTPMCASFFGPHGIIGGEF